MQECKYLTKKGCNETIIFFNTIFLSAISNTFYFMKIFHEIWISFSMRWFGVKFARFAGSFPPPPPLRFPFIYVSQLSGKGREPNDIILFFFGFKPHYFQTSPCFLVFFSCVFSPCFRFPSKSSSFRRSLSGFGSTARCAVVLNSSMWKQNRGFFKSDLFSWVWLWHGVLMSSWFLDWLYLAILCYIHFLTCTNRPQIQNPKSKIPNSKL